MLLARHDYAQELLIPFLKKTEELIHEVLLSLDPKATARISPAADLGFPHDVIRIAGGFATGAYVEWDCSVPFIPVDTTVNIDTSSIFYLEEDISSSMNKDVFSKLQSKLEESSYIFNFHKGNHFISFGRTIKSNEPVLVIHSNEKEFKYQYNGLMPVAGNWYMDDVEIYKKGGRYLRFIKGAKAEMFYKIAKMLEEYNVIRHRFIAELLISSKSHIKSQVDHHHYYMPNSQSVAVGCFTILKTEEVPIFSSHGEQIHIFKPKEGGTNKISSLAGDEVFIVPHGWGKTSTTSKSFSIDYEQGTFTLSGRQYNIKPKVSLGRDERLSIRSFSSDPESPNSLFRQMEKSCPGNVVESIEQICSYSKHGFNFHKKNNSYG